MSKYFNISKVFEHWKAAHTNLTSVVQSYERACSELQDAIDSTEYHRSTDYLTTRILEEVDSALASLQFEEQRLRNTRITLSVLRNRSQHLSPIFQVPFDILSSIFTFASCQCESLHYMQGPSLTMSELAYRENDISPATLASVCSVWRRVALESPSLWAHIDIAVSPYWRVFNPVQVMLWIERSHQIPLQVHIFELERGIQLCATSEIKASSDLPRFLALTMHRATETRITTIGQDLLDMSVECFFNFCNPNLSRSLGMENHTARRGYQLTLNIPLKYHNTEKAIRMFKSCDKLTLRDCITSPGLGCHEGLTDLRLSCFKTTVELPILLAMLAACPRLHNLVLRVGFSSPIEHVRVQELQLVNLNYLERISVNCYGVWSGSHTLLPYLSIGSNSLNMDLAMSPHPRHANTYHDFFQRTTFSRLDIILVEFEDTRTFQPIFCPIPHVKVLGLHLFNLTQKSFEDILPNQFGINKVDVWPTLHTLCLIKSKVSLSFIEELWEIPSIRMILATDVVIEDFGGSDADDRLEQLRELFPEMQSLNYQRKIGDWEYDVLYNWKMIRS